MFVHTGDYTPHTDETALQSTYFTFTPVPLMDGNFCTMGDDLAALLVRTHRSLGILEGMAAFLPDKEVLADLLLFRECCFSKMIDYPGCDIKNVLIKQDIDNSRNKIENIVSAYRYAMEISVRKLSFNTIATCAGHGVDAQRRITLREKPMFLSQSSSNYRQYNPTSPSKIRPALNDITSYIDSNDADVLIKMAMCHYQFEMIHPYNCYNGIVGRILPYHILSNAKMSGAGFLCLSASLFHHKDEYFDKLGSTQRSGNYSIWIDFFISAIQDAAEKSISFIRHYNEYTGKDETRILSRTIKKKDSTLEVYRHFIKNIVSTIGAASEHLSLTHASVSRSVAILQDMGILSQVDRGARNRHFAHAAIFERFISPE